MSTEGKIAGVFLTYAFIYVACYVLVGIVLTILIMMAVVLGIALGIMGILVGLCRLAITKDRRRIDILRYFTKNVSYGLLASPFTLALVIYLYSDSPQEMGVMRTVLAVVMSIPIILYMVFAFPYMLYTVFVTLWSTNEMPLKIILPEGGWDRHTRQVLSLAAVGAFTPLSVMLGVSFIPGLQ